MTTCKYCGNHDGEHYPKCRLNQKPMVIILDDNPISLMGYAEEFPENWKKICEALEKNTNSAQSEINSKPKDI